MGDTPSGEAPERAGSLPTLHSVAIEAALVPLQTELAGLRRQLNDQGRQNSKDCIVFEGTALEPKENETVRTTLLRVVSTYWGVTLQDWEVKQVHFLKSGQEKWRMVAKFNRLDRGSAFHEILHNSAKVEGTGLTLWRHLHTVTKNDRRLGFIARQMRKAKEIERFVFDSVSGRLKVTFPGQKESQSFSEASDLLARCSPTLNSKIADLDKAHKRRKPMLDPAHGK